MIITSTIFFLQFSGFHVILLYCHIKIHVKQREPPIKISVDDERSLQIVQFLPDKYFERQQSTNKTITLFIVNFNYIYADCSRFVNKKLIFN